MRADQEGWVEQRIGRTRSRRWAGPGLLLAVAACLAFAGGAEAQGQGAERVRVFLDCQTRGCPETEFRTEIAFVDWVRDRTIADLHVIVTAQRAAVGTEYVFDLVGQEDFTGESASVTVDVSDTATQDERLTALTRTFKAALVPYVVRRGYADRLEITVVEEAEGAPRRVDPAADPWNLWVMRVGVRGEASGEEQQREYRLGGNVSAWRVTEDWKIDLNLDGTHSEEEFELSDGLRVFTRDEWDLDALIVKSLTAHWSAGTEVGVERSTRLNREVGGRVALAVEWNLFPYVEANRRQFLFHYQLGYSHVRYEEETIFGKTREDLFDQRAALLWESRQPWGDGSLGAFYSNYLHDWTKYQLSLGGEISVRLVRGLDLDIEGSYDLIRNQIYLPAAELDDEDILVQQRQLATGYEYDIEIGLSYRFGSIFNNVVNNRFPWMVRRF